MSAGISWSGKRWRESINYLIKYVNCFIIPCFASKIQLYLYIIYNYFNLHFNILMILYLFIDNKPDDFYTVVNW